MCGVWQVEGWKLRRGPASLTNDDTQAGLRANMLLWPTCAAHSNTCNEGNTLTTSSDECKTAM